MELKQLESYVAVVRYGSFTRAADVLFTSQPTVSAHVRSLEEELETRLLLRTTKTIEMTEKGRELYDLAVHMLELRDSMLARWKRTSGSILQVGASTIPSAYILPEVLPSFGKLYPDIYFKVHQGDSAEIAGGVRSGLYDIGLVGMPCGDEGITCHPFLQDRMVLITPVTETFLAYQKMETPPIREILSEPIILREPGSGSGKSADRFLESMGIQSSDLNVAARINDQESVKNLVAGGLGVSILSERAARNLKEEKRILVFSLPGELSKRNLYYLLPDGGLRSKAAEAFVRHLCAHYKDPENLPGKGSI